LTTREQSTIFSYSDHPSTEFQTDYFPLQKDFVCDECQFAARELKVIVEDKEKQQEIRDFLSQNVCKHIPRYQGMCDMLIEQFLPEMFQELDTMLKDPKAACADVGFCPRTSPPRKLTAPHADTPIHPMYAFFRAAKTIETPTGSVLMSCLECKVAVEEAVNGLVKDRNEQAAAVQKFACHELLPSNFSASCDDFLSLYLPTVLYMTWEQITPEGFCTEKMKSCDSISMSRLSSMSKSVVRSFSCHTCSGMQKYYQTMMDRPVTMQFQQFVVDELKRSVCDHTAILATTCDRFVEGVVPRLISKFADISKSEDFCAKVGLATTLYGTFAEYTRSLLAMPTS
ncbi:surfactant protein B, partial [Cooperia oncophora]